MNPLFPSGHVAAAAPARARILGAAHDLFYRDGIRATGVDRVIAQAQVTKVTFYRHFPSKNDLIVAYLDARHAQWMAWFGDALTRHKGRGKSVWPGVVRALREWFMHPDFRGCAFLNAVVEIEEALPVVAEITRRHKADMAQAIASLLPATKSDSVTRADMAAMAVDGAIMRAQMDGQPEAALRLLERVLASI